MYSPWTHFPSYSGGNEIVPVTVDALNWWDTSLHVRAAPWGAFSRAVWQHVEQLWVILLCTGHMKWLCLYVTETMQTSSSWGSGCVHRENTENTSSYKNVRDLYKKFPSLSCAVTSMMSVAWFWFYFFFSLVQTLCHLNLSVLSLSLIYLVHLKFLCHCQLLVLAKSMSTRIIELFNVLL